MRLAWVCILFAIACGSGKNGSTDVEPTLVFADRTNGEITRLASAALGNEGFQASAQLFKFNVQSPTACPLIDERPGADVSTVILTGGCTTTDGITVAGTASLTNAGWHDLSYDFTKPSSYEFASFSLTTEAGRQAWNGIFDQGLSALDLDLTSERLGIAVRSDTYIECTASTSSNGLNSSSCEHGNSGVELVGVGGALVSGQIISEQSLSGSLITKGSLTLEGVDTVKVTVGNDNCVSWELVGTGRSFDPCP